MTFFITLHHFKLGIVAGPPVLHLYLGWFSIGIMAVDLPRVAEGYAVRYDMCTSILAAMGERDPDLIDMASDILDEEIEERKREAA